VPNWHNASARTPLRAAARTTRCPTLVPAKPVNRRPTRKYGSDAACSDGA